MNNILNKTDLCAQYSQLVTMKEKSRIIPAIMTLVSVVLLALANTIVEAETLSITLFTAGVVVLIVGIVKLIRPSHEIIYLKTGEKVTRRFEGHEQEHREKVTNILKSGDFKALASVVAKNSSAPIVSVTYTTPSDSLRIGQILHYVPYEYAPLSDVFIHTTK